ncbi:MAG: hypothetical protein SCM57_13620, partial [Bacillota bacterium]|nr:hypothetical protein [Bacillota bacterium]
MALMGYLVVILAGSLIIIPLWADVLRMAGHLEPNYRGRAIPQSMGAIYTPVFILAAGWALWWGLVPADILLRALIVAVGMGLLGLVDDIWGDARAKGFAGHFRRLIQGEVTTGLIKAAAGFLIAAWAVAGLPGFLLLLIWRASIVALSANLINLLDLRPGRSLKGFFLLSLLYAWRVPSETGITLLFPFLLASLVYLPWDLAGKGMLGDAGANVLGGMLGLAVVL